MIKIEEAITAPFSVLLHHIETGGLKHGTSASTGVMRIEVAGKWYEVQVTFESEERNWIDNTIAQSRVLGPQSRLS